MNCRLWIGFIFATATETVLHSSGQFLFVTPGDNVTLPCAGSSRCSSVNWTKTYYTGNLPSALVSFGRVTTPDPNITLLRDCSLQLRSIDIDDATTYVCDNGIHKTTTNLRILCITELVTAHQIELQCFVNDYIGLAKDCNKSGLQVRWLAEDHTVIKQGLKRFQLKEESHCFLKLFIFKKRTDHQRKWTCEVSVNGSAKATVSHTTTVADGIEEVFAAVGESLSLACTNTSSLGLTGKGQTGTSITFTDSAAIIRKVSPLYAKEYDCIDKEKGEAYKIRLHTLDITSELDPSGEKVTLTCVLTCANSTCDEDFSLTWSQEEMNSSVVNVSGSLISNLSLPLGPGERVCSVLREGVRVATKKWHRDDSLPGLVWIAIPLALLFVAAAGLFCVYKKRKHNEDAEQLQDHIRMSHVYEDVTECEPQHKREAITSNDSFYDLLQAVY